jgi:hypothetical protein
LTLFVLSSLDDKSLKDTFPHRKSIRLSGDDYRQQRDFFVTLCTQDKLCLFGQTIVSTMILNQYGQIAESVWQELPLHCPDINNNYIHRDAQSCSRSDLN